MRHCAYLCTRHLARPACGVVMMMMMMTLCIRYKAQLAVTTNGPSHTTHFVLLEEVSGGLTTPLPTRTLRQTKSIARSHPAAALSRYITPSSPRSARRRLVRPCCLAAQPAHCPCPPGRGGCVVALVVALRRSPSCLAPARLCSRPVRRARKPRRERSPRAPTS